MEIDDKIKLISEAVSVSTEQDARRTLQEYQPKMSLNVICNLENNVPFTVEILLSYVLPNKDYENDIVGDISQTVACNWTGLGKTLDEALTSALCCLRYELEDRLAEMQKVLDKIKESLPQELK